MKKYQDQNPKAKIGFSSFVLLRPKECVLPGVSGTHSVFVFTILQNVKLMHIASKILEVCVINDYKHAIVKITCYPPSPECFFKECQMCPSVDCLKKTRMKDMKRFLLMR